jgi:F-type H+-transporting ATPase subunit delta
VFHGDRWAFIFVSTLGQNAGGGLDCLRALAPAVKAMPGVLFGHSAAGRLELILRESAEKAKCEKTEILEYTIRFIVLLAEKKLFNKIDIILEKIEDKLNQQKGILNVEAELAAPFDNDFKENFERRLASRLGVNKIVMKTKLAPELLGGFRLQIGGFYIDASLKGQLEKMKTELGGR